MSQFLTLEQAAEKLGLSPSEFKKRLRTEWTHLKPIQGGGTQQFKAKDIEEIARQIGFGSEEELRLADPSSSEELMIPSSLDLSSDSPILTPSAESSAMKTKPQELQDDAPLSLGDSNAHLGDKDVFLLADEEPKATPKPSAPKRSQPDSDVRLEKSTKAKKPPQPSEGTEEEIDIAVMPMGGSSTRVGKSGKLTAGSSSKLGGGSKPPSASKSGKLPAIPESDSSEFELTLDPDSSDEFELSLTKDSSDEISLGEMPTTTSKNKNAASGINIDKPIDSGISLENKGGESGKKSSKKIPPAPAPEKASDEEIDFELSLDQAGASSKKIASSSGKNLDSDSEFELTLDESDIGSSLDLSPTTNMPVLEEEKNDIFETDFEIPALDDDSASELVVTDEADTDLDSSSDFDLEIDEPGDAAVEDESASQVVILDDETDEPAPVKSKAKKKQTVEDSEDVVIEDDAVSFDDMEMDESVSASKALQGVKEEDEDDAEEAAEQERVMVVSGSAPWGAFPAIFMLPTVFIVFICGLMAYEMMQSMWGYHQGTKPASLIIDGLAEKLELLPKE